VSSRVVRKTPKRSVDEEVLERVRRLKMKWLRANRAALQAYNEHVKKHGVFSEGLRSF